MACGGSRKLCMHQEATHASKDFGERAPRAWRYVSQSGTMTDVKEGSGQASLEERRASGIFVGRERELAELLAGVDEALEGRGRLFLVAGEPGIGKSRLTDELAAQARHRGVRVLYGRCWEAGGAPTYWPWVQALRAYVRDQPPDALRGQLGEGSPELDRSCRRCARSLGRSAADVARPEGRGFASLTRLLRSCARLRRSAAADRARRPQCGGHAVAPLSSVHRRRALRDANSACLRVSGCRRRPRRRHVAALAIVAHPLARARPFWG